MNLCARWLTLAAGTLFVMHGAAYAQTATVYGSLGNFDVANNQQQEAHGFEIELEGLHPEDIVFTYDHHRYGAPTVRATDLGVGIRWESAIDPVTGLYAATTVPHQSLAPLNSACYQWSPGYDAAGCEHFGVTVATNAQRSTYRWLVADASGSGALVPGPVQVPVAAPIYSVTPPAAAGNPPVLNADVDAPDRPDFPTHYGDAQWMKVFRTQLAQPVGLDDLLSDNASVPQDASHLEVSWFLLQADPLIKFTKGGKSRGRTRNGGPLAGDTRAVVRRYELYEYTGAYDPVFHQAVCADPTCATPAADEVGDIVSAQMTAAIVSVPSIAVSKTGNGSVASLDRRISCGSTCTAAYDSGATVTLVALPISGAAFSGWTGACSGSGLTCTVNVTAHLDVGATFASAPTAVNLSVGVSNRGVVVSLAGILCPGNCSVKFTAGSVVTLTAVPLPGKPFAGWGGACSASGTAPSCSFVITKDSQVQATFRK